MALPLQRRPNSGLRDISFLQRAFFFGLSLLFCFNQVFYALPCSLLQAEELNISGLKFNVDELEALDDQNIKLSVRGESLIIPKANLEQEVLRIFLLDSQYASAIEDKKLEAFVIENLSKNKIGHAVLGLKILINRHSARPEYSQSFFESLPASIAPSVILEMQRALILELRNLESGRAFMVYPMYQIGLRDPDWLRLNATAAVYALAANLKELAGREFSRALAVNDLAAIEAILRFLQDLFGLEDAVYRKFRLAQSRILEVKQLLEQKKVELITPWLRGIKDDPELYALLGDFVSDTLKLQARSYLQAGSPDLALRALVWVEAQRRTPQLHALVLEALERLTIEQRLHLADSAIAEMLLLYANNDAAVASTYQSILAQQVNLLLEQKQPSQSEIYFSQLERLKLRDFDLVDQLRIQQALVYARMGFNAIARKKLQQVSGGIGLIDRARLAMLGLYSHNAMRLALVFSILTFGSAWFLVRYKRVADEAANLSQSESAHSTNGSKPGPEVETGRVTFSARSRARDPRTEEYAVCLRVLGLQSTSTLKEIKSAYRSKVKEAHPDRQVGGTDTASDRFIQLTSAYERALELRTELGIVDA